MENSSNPPALVIITTNAPPVVSITSPVSNTVYVATIGSIGITATASDVTGVAEVQFFQGTNSLWITNSLGVATAYPYGVTWNNLLVGTNWLKAVVVGNGGLSTTSTVVSVIVDMPPSVTLTNPAAGAVFIAGTNIILGASASDTGGAVQQVQFFQGTNSLWITNSLGVDTSAPYSVTWSSAAAGIYYLTAVATDNNGITTTSAPVNIVVDALPLVSITSPLDNNTFGSPTSITIAATATSSDGTSPQVQFYVGNNLLGTEPSAPYSWTWNNPPVGTYVLKAVATDDYGLISTATVTNITVSTNLMEGVNAYVWAGSHATPIMGGARY